MKKIIFSLLGIAVIVIIAITSCQKPDEVINPNLNKLSFESFDINPDIITLSEGIDQKAQKHYKYVQHQTLLVLVTVLLLQKWT